MIGRIYFDFKNRVELLAVAFVAPRGLPIFSTPVAGSRRASRLLGEAAWTCVHDNAQIGFVG